MTDPTRRVLVVEDRDSLRKLMSHALTKAGYLVSDAADVTSAASLLAETTFDLVFSDLKLPDGTGLDVVATGGRLQPTTPIIVLTAFGTISTAVEAMRLGAVDFIEKPLEIDDLIALAATWTDTAGSSGEVFEVAGAPPIIGAHPTLRIALRLLERAAPADSTILLQGESGTGKELFARAAHALSPRRDGPFVAVNCAAIPESLLETELFGHEKGAFTGAGRRHIGRFEAAGGGTLFLDEIGELGAGVQGKVLRVLDLRSFERVGSHRSIAANVRLVAATNRDLAAMVSSGDFRADLFYRLEVFPIVLPPLRDRASDIPCLARHLLVEIASRLGTSPNGLSDAGAKLLQEQEWPGNVRQLANLLERAVLLTDEHTLGANHLALALGPAAAEARAEPFRAALLASGGDTKKASEILGISRRTMQRRIDEHDLGGVGRYRE